MEVLINFWEQTIENFTKKATEVTGLGDVRVHIDLQEPGFGDTQTIMPEEWPELHEKAIADVHLMVKQPERWLQRVKAAKPNIQHVIGQIEMLEDVATWLTQCRMQQLIPGIGINYGTEIHSIEAALKNCVKTIEEGVGDRPQLLLMGYPAGFLNQHFHEDVYDKIKSVRGLVGNNAEIIVDGGIDFEIAVKCREVGADGVAAYSYIWKNFPENYFKLKTIK